MKSEGLVRASFWTLWAATVVCTAYGVCAGCFGIGLILPDDGFPQPSPRGEIQIAIAVDFIAIAGLALSSLLVGKWSPRLQRLGYITVLVLAGYWTVSRF